MRLEKSAGPLRLRCIAGTRVIMMAFDMDAAARKGLRGFAMKWKISGSHDDPEWLPVTRYYKDLVPKPQPNARYSCRQHPVQSFLWSDYYASPATSYDFTVVALYGPIGKLEERHEINFKIQTEPENDGRHGVWFNAGAIASHDLHHTLKDKKLTKAQLTDVDENGRIRDPEVKFLSRGLLEACLRFINGTKGDEGLRVCAYEFTYPPVLNALKRAHDRGVDVKIIYHGTKAGGGQNAKPIANAKLPKSILTPRSRTKIPHNKFIIRLNNKGKPKAVWTGSTNFTDSGFFGQTNVGHLVTDDKTAAGYLDYWTKLKTDPVLSAAKTEAMALTPNPPNAIDKGSIARFYSPRIGDNMLDWYAARVEDAASSVVMTLPFNVAPTILNGLGAKSDAFRMVVLEDPPSKEVHDSEFKNRPNLVFSNGGLFGNTLAKRKSPTGGGAYVPVAYYPTEKWFVKEELRRSINAGHVFFIHSKILLIDPLSDDPLVCTGSANFSKNSLIANDENMLLIRGEKRVADIYITEIDRIFRHFYARNAVNRISARTKGKGKNPNELDTDFKWVESNYQAASYKNSRRLTFFPTGAQPTPWATQAKQDADAFVDEDQRPARWRQEARDRAAAKKGAPKKAAKRGTAKNSEGAKSAKAAAKSKKGAKKKR